MPLSQIEGYKTGFNKYQLRIQCGALYSPDASNTCRLSYSLYKDPSADNNFLELFKGLTTLFAYTLMKKAVFVLFIVK